MLSATNRAKLNNDNPTNQEVKLAEAMARSVIVVETKRAASATAASTFVCPVGIKILFVSIRGLATASNGTLRLSSGSDNITDAIKCEAAGTQFYSGSIAAAHETVAAGATLTLTAGGAGAADVAGDVVIYGIAV